MQLSVRVTALSLAAVSHQPVTKDMLDLARHIVNQKAGRFDPEKFEDHYETALIELINRKRAGKPITPKEKPAATNVVDLMEALRRSVGQEAAPAKAGKPAKKQGGGRPEGDADADCRQEADEGGGREEACGGQAAQISVGFRKIPGSDSYGSLTT